MRRSLRKSLCNLAPDNAEINLNMNEDSRCAENKPSLSLQHNADCTTPAELLPVGLAPRVWKCLGNGPEWGFMDFLGAELDKQGVGVKLCELGCAWPLVDCVSWNI